MNLYAESNAVLAWLLGDAGGEAVRKALASALAARSAIPGVALLSLDDRMRRCGRQLGFDIFPA